MTATDVDKSGASYYGEQGLYYLSAKGDGNIIPLSKSLCLLDKFISDIFACLLAQRRKGPYMLWNGVQAQKSFVFVMVVSFCNGDN